ncbi:hypothetical protein [Thermocaproicibacter melissae]|uniref:hypothetical protein n=1 Tax=Thermocaproicibacter melissae TaxID=2966552 RepID=UPI0024B17E59|nr:hypothetical protein [Thermocaproicibacter melissae]WBY64030.1 hypothetical protein NOG13_08765 [Thermocaproicibacter melissae]
MAELLMKISWALFALSAAALICAVVFWVKFKIPKIIGDLTGRTAKKEIAKMRSENEKTGKMTLQPQFAARNSRGRYPTVTHLSPVSAAVRNSKSAPVTLQAEAGQTGILADNWAQGPANRAEETTMLSNTLNKEEMAEETTALLSPPERQQAVVVADRKSVQLEMLDDEISVHTDEVIP